MVAAFVIMGLLYSVASHKIDHWTTMQLLDEPGKCPGPFLTNPGVYRFISFLFFAGFGASGLASSIPKWASLGVVVFVWIVAGISGRKAAFRKYREGAAEGRQLFSGSDYAGNPQREDMIKWAEGRMLKTDGELQEEADRALRRR